MKDHTKDCLKPLNKQIETRTFPPRDRIVPPINTRQKSGTYRIATNIITGMAMARRSQKDHDIHVAGLVCFAGLRNWPWRKTPMNTNPARIKFSPKTTDNNKILREAILA